MRRRWWSRPRRRRATATSLLCLIAVLVAGCRDGPDPGAGAPLFDADHVPEVLVESRQLEPPPSLGGNSFVRGWSPWRERLARFREAVHLVAQGGSPAVLAIVNLEARPRTLELISPRLVSGAADARLEAGWAGDEAQAAPATAAEIALPAAAVLGRATLELRLPAGAALAVDGAGLREALPAGEARLAGEDLTQTGFSLVDVARRLAGPTVLTGRFVPPQDPDSAQSFTLLVERDGQSAREAWSWRPTPWSRLRGERSLALALGGAGLVRLRFLARGTGPSATWKDLRLESAALEAEPLPPPPPRPRLVLLYVMDALRADHVSHLGGPAGLTPTLDRLAAEGVVLAGHQSLAPNTLPSVKTIFTGKVYIDDGMAGLPPAPQGPAVLAELFARAGYASGLFTGNGYVFYQADRGFDRVEESTLFERHPEAPYNDNAERVHAAALAWLARLPPEQPVFLYVHTVHPHNPYVPPPALARRFTAGIDSQIPADTKTLLAAKHGRIPLGESDRERIRALYRAGVAYNDAELAGFLATLADRVPAPELLAIFTADHGEELFDHGGLLHGYTLHREQLQVPLTFWWPGRLAPRKVEPPTDHVDLHTTLRRLLDPAAPAAPGSRDLWPVLTGAAALPEERLRFAAAAGVPGGIFSVQSPRLKLVWAPREGAGWGQGEGLGRARDAVALYDLAADPLETVNMAGAETVEVAWLRSRLLAWIAHHRPQAEPAAPEPATAEQRENLEALGYVE